MTLPTLQQAHGLVANLADEFHRLHMNTYGNFGHYLRVAKNAQKIALAIPGLNPDKAYIMGLLHDYGQAAEVGDKHYFHGLIGYQQLLAMGYDEAARAALVHSFFENEEITPESYHSYDRQSIIKCAEILRLRPFDDYDRLVHLADLTATGSKATTIERRFEYLAVQYKINEKMIAQKFLMACQLKAYFDKLCKRNIYDVLHLKILSYEK